MVFKLGYLKPPGSEPLNNFTFIVLSIILFIAPTFAQQDGEEIFTVVEQMPCVISCMDEVRADARRRCCELVLRKKMTDIVFPESLKGKIKKEKVTVQFIVTKHGSITNIAIIDSSDFTVLNQLVLNQVHTLPRLMPGRQRGQKVNVQYVFQICFKCNGIKCQVSDACK